MYLYTSVGVSNENIIIIIIIMLSKTMTSQRTEVDWKK